MSGFKPCTVDGCDGNAHWTMSGSSGMCRKHYQRFRRNGDALGGRVSPGELPKYLREVVLAYEGDECLIWPHSRNSRGYAVMKHNGRQHFVSRLVCVEHRGPPPDTTFVGAHSCGRGHLGCVTKRHIRWATPQENSDDRDVHGTVPRGESRWNSKITEDDVRRIRALQGTMTQAAIGAIFGISQVNVGLIQNRKAWAAVD